MNNPKNHLINFIGIIFLFFGILAIINQFSLERYPHTIWFCYFAMILIGIGILTKKENIIITQIYILLIPLIVWNLDFFYLLITNQPLLGITDYFFNGNFGISHFISLQHLFTIPLSLYAIYLIKPKKQTSIKLGIIEITILYIITRIFTSPESNINCIYESCASFSLNFYYPLQWFLIFILMIVLSKIILQPALNLIQK